MVLKYVIGIFYQRTKFIWWLHIIKSLWQSSLFNVHWYMMITMSMFKIYGVYKGRFCVDKQGRFCQKGLLYWKCKRKNGWKILNVVQFSFLKVNRNIIITFSTSTCTSKLPSLEEKKVKFTSFVHEYDKCIANVFSITRCPT